jgi:hypothetical protein
MKRRINILLGVFVCIMLYICFASVMTPINFNKIKHERERKIITLLTDIRKAQQEYRKMHNGEYTSNFDTLIYFVRKQKIPFIIKEGNLSDKQLASGLTEKKAVYMVKKARKTGNWDEVKKNRLTYFKRDTLWVSLKDTLFGKHFNPEYLRYIPFGHGREFEMETRRIMSSSNEPINLLEVRAPFDTYLDELDPREIERLKEDTRKTGKYAGLQLGSINTPNNNTGNWE